MTRPSAQALAAALTALFLSACNCGEQGLRQGRPIFVLQTTAVDFGPVPEGQSETRGVTVENAGQSTLVVEGALDPASSIDFVLPQPKVEIAPGEQGRIEVGFVPSGSGSDAGVLLLSSNDAAAPTASVALSGGPIAPAVLVSPNPVDFAPATQVTVQKNVTLANDGLAILHVDAVSLSPAGNPDFAMEPVPTPLALPPGMSRTLVLEYTRGLDATPGRLVIESDDPEKPVYEVDLLPDPLAACANGMDDDGDGLVDYPDDPGCADLEDDDETDPPECLEGASQPCGTDEGACTAGMQRCTGGRWGPCEGATEPAPEVCDGIDNDCDGIVDEGVTEACSAGMCMGTRTCVEGGMGEWGACTAPTTGDPELCDGIDNDCNGIVDDGVMPMACTVNGCSGTQRCLEGGTGEWGFCIPDNPQTEVCDGIDNDCDGQTDEDGVCTQTCDPDVPDVYTLTMPSRIVYRCCNFLGSTIVNIDVDQFQFQLDGARIQPLGNAWSPGQPLSGMATTCPSGTFSNTLTLSGGCTERYRLEGSFVDATTWTGTFYLEFTGSQCTDPVLCGGSDCIGTSFPVTATR